MFIVLVQTFTVVLCMNFIVFFENFIKFSIGRQSLSLIVRFDFLFVFAWTNMVFLAACNFLLLLNQNSYQKEINGRLFLWSYIKNLASVN